MSSSRGSSQPRDQTHVCYISLRWQVGSLPLAPPGKPCILLAAAKSLQSCPTLCDPRDSSPWGSLVPGILHARTLEWVAISFSNAWKWKVKVKSLSRVWLLVTPWTAAHQVPPSMGFSRQECWSGCHRLLRTSCYTVHIFLYCWLFGFFLVTYNHQFHWN